MLWEEGSVYLVPLHSKTAYVSRSIHRLTSQVQKLRAEYKRVIIITLTSQPTWDISSHDDRGIAEVRISIIIRDQNSKSIQKWRSRTDPSLVTCPISVRYVTSWKSSIILK